MSNQLTVTSHGDAAMRQLLARICSETFPSHPGSFELVWHDNKMRYLLDTERRVDNKLARARVIVQFYETEQEVEAALAVWMLLGDKANVYPAFAYDVPRLYTVHLVQPRTNPSRPLSHLLNIAQFLNQGYYVKVAADLAELVATVVSVGSLLPGKIKCGVFGHDGMEAVVQTHLPIGRDGQLDVYSNQAIQSSQSWTLEEYMTFLVSRQEYVRWTTDKSNGFAFEVLKQLKCVVSEMTRMDKGLVPSSFMLYSPTFDLEHTLLQSTWEDLDVPDWTDAQFLPKFAAMPVICRQILYEPEKHHIPPKFYHQFRQELEGWIGQSIKMWEDDTSRLLDRIHTLLTTSQQSRGWVFALERCVLRWNKIKRTHNYPSLSLTREGRIPTRDRKQAPRELVYQHQVRDFMRSKLHRGMFELQYVQDTLNQSYVFLATAARSFTDPNALFVVRLNASPHRPEQIDRQVHDHLQDVGLLRFVGDIVDCGETSTNQFGTKFSCIELPAGAQLSALLATEKLSNTKIKSIAEQQGKLVQFQLQITSKYAKLAAKEDWPISVQWQYTRQLHVEQDRDQCDKFSWNALFRRDQTVFGFISFQLARWQQFTYDTLEQTGAKTHEYLARLLVMAKELKAMHMLGPDIFSLWNPQYFNSAHTFVCEGKVTTMLFWENAMYVPQIVHSAIPDWIARRKNALELAAVYGRAVGSFFKQYHSSDYQFARELCIAAIIGPMPGFIESMDALFAKWVEYRQHSGCMLKRVEGSKYLDAWDHVADKKPHIQYTTKQHTDNVFTKL